MKETLDIQYAVLTDATEDCMGLWESVLEHMDLIEDDEEWEREYEEYIPLAQYLLRDFVSKGLITLEQCKRWLKDANNPLIYSASYIPIAPEDVLSVIEVRSHWYPPEEGINEWIGFYRTEKGLQVWYGGKAALERVLK